MNENFSDDDLTKTTKIEKFHKISKLILKSSTGVLAPIGLSSLASELFDLVVSDPAARRRDRFLMSLAKRIVELENSGKIIIEEILDSEEVSALIFRSAQAAMRSSGDKKFEVIHNVALTGIMSGKRGKTSSAQIVVGLLDRMTEHHIVRLLWKQRGERHYTLGQIMDPDNEEARRSMFYGQPVSTDKSTYSVPRTVYSYMDFSIYVEDQEYIAFELAGADLVAMGLFAPIYGTEEHLEGRRVIRRTTSEVVGYKVSGLGMFVCNYVLAGGELHGDNL